MSLDLPDQQNDGAEVQLPIPSEYENQTYTLSKRYTAQSLTTSANIANTVGGNAPALVAEANKVSTEYIISLGGLQINKPLLVSLLELNSDGKVLDLINISGEGISLVFTMPEDLLGQGYNLSNIQGGYRHGRFKIFTLDETPVHIGHASAIVVDSTTVKAFVAYVQKVI